MGIRVSGLHKPHQITGQKIRVVICQTMKLRRLSSFSQLANDEH
jgi:hypothetical protein